MTYFALWSEGNCLLFRTDSLLLLVLVLMTLKKFEFVGTNLNLLGQFVSTWQNNLLKKVCSKVWNLSYHEKVWWWVSSWTHNIYLPFCLLLSFKCFVPQFSWALFPHPYFSAVLSILCCFSTWSLVQVSVSCFSFFPLMSTISHSKYRCYSILSLLHHAYSPCFCLSFFLVFFVAGNWNGTTVLDRPGVTLDTDTAYCVTISCRHRWVRFSSLVCAFLDRNHAILNTGALSAM